MSYKKTDLHRFIRSHLILNGYKIEENEDHFSVKYPEHILPIKYTYNPEISENRNIELVTPGSRFFNKILKNTLEDGIVSAIEIHEEVGIDENRIRSFFTRQEERCSECIKGRYETCPKLIKCKHKINNATIKEISDIQKSKSTLLQFYFLVEFNNRLRKGQEIIPVAISLEGEMVSPFDIDENKFRFQQMETIDNINSKKYIKKSIDVLKRIVKKKSNFFNKQLDHEVSKKIQKIEKKFKDERMEKVLNKEKFDEKDWEKQLKRTIDSERKSLSTEISIRLINCLIINTPSVEAQVTLSNGTTLKLNMIDKFQQTLHPKCFDCSKIITEGFATEDRKYSCDECVLRCTETGRIFSNKQKERLDMCRTSHEILSTGAGFRCSNCSSPNSKHFMYRCSEKGEPICVKCYEFCNYCDRPFSIKNMNKCNEDSKLYCNTHSIKCNKCGTFINIINAKFSGQTQGGFCKCVNAPQCKICEDFYSPSYLTDGKCQGCKNLKFVIQDTKEISRIRLRNKEYEKTTDWLVGANKYNKIIVAKGENVDSIFVSNPMFIRFIKKAKVASL